MRTFWMQAERRSAFDNAGLNGPVSTLIDKVAVQANKVTDTQGGVMIATFKRAGDVEAESI